MRQEYKKDGRIDGDMIPQILETIKDSFLAQLSCCLSMSPVYSRDQHKTTFHCLGILSVQPYSFLGQISCISGSKLLLSKNQILHFVYLCLCCILPLVEFCRALINRFMKLSCTTTTKLSNLFTRGLQGR